MDDRPATVDRDVELPRPARRRGPVWAQARVLGAIAAGGVAGSLARYGLALAWPAPAGRLPWATLTTNVAGCMLIGVLMVLLSEVWAAHRLARPFLGVGVLGGFTTFSTYAAETRDLLQPGTVAIAFAYLAATLLAAMLAVVAGVWLTRAAARRARWN